MNVNIVNSLEEMEKAKKYWMEALSGGPGEIHLPADFAKTSEIQMDEYHMTFDDELSMKLLSTVKGQYPVFYVLLLAALKVLLYKLTGQKDITVGSPIYKSEGGFTYNKYIPMRDWIDEGVSFRELLSRVKNTVAGGYKNQHYPLDKVYETLEMDVSLLLKVVLGFENIHDARLINENAGQSGYFTLSVCVDRNSIAARVVYNSRLFTLATVKRFSNFYVQVLEQVLSGMNEKIECIELANNDDKKRILFDFNHTAGLYPKDKTIHSLFEDMVDKVPDHMAVVLGDEKITYKDLDLLANRVAAYLKNENSLKPGQRVGVFMDRSIHMVAAILGILKAGGAYVPLSPELPEERLKGMINDAGIEVLLSSGKCIRMLNRIQWECPQLHTFLCMDSENVYAEREPEKGELMDRELWEYVGESAEDDIAGGGWVNSYTGEYFSREEMDEYAENIFEKLKPFLGKNTRILEIGCASGISMFKIAPLVGFYYGTDLSGVIIEKNRARVEKENLRNIHLQCLPADEIDRIEEGDFDIVIINSVIQAFPGHNYLRQVISKAINLMSENGILFAGDIMDQALKKDLHQSLVDYKRMHSGAKTKTDLSEELFLSRGFFEDLQHEFTEITKVTFSNKQYMIENELTRFRYDTVLEIKKSGSEKIVCSKKHKYQQDAGRLRKYPPLRTEEALEPESLAYVIYTSGTTGRPKGVMIEHKGIANLKMFFEKEFEIQHHDRILQFASSTFDASVWEMFMSLLSGATLFIVPDETIGSFPAFEDFLNANRITVATLPPTYLANLEPSRIRTLRKLITAGSAVSPELVEKWKDCVHCINAYGPTETTVCATFWDYKELDDCCVSVPVGKPVSNTRVYILDPSGRILPVGVEGELCVAGVGLARGYLNMPGLTEAKFTEVSFTCDGEVYKERVYKTGDLARWLDDGNIEFLGRMDHQVKIRGFRIELEEIEYHLKKNEAVREVVVLGRDDGSGDKMICAYIVSESEADWNQLREHLKKELPEYMIPSFFVKLDRIPLTVNGKVDRKKLLELDLETVSTHDYQEPQSETEQKLHQIWQDVLGLKRIGINDNFFELGGHSLKATTLVSKIHRDFQVEMPLREVFERRTIKELAKYIVQSEKHIYSDIQPVKKLEYYPVSSAQKRMYLLNKLETVLTNYNIPGAILLEGSLDAGRLKTAFRDLVKRHETLRTSFEFIDEELVQRVHEDLTFEMDFTDVSGREEHSDIQVFEGMAEKMILDFIRPFELEKAPLFRVHLVKAAEEKYILMYDMHHIISDGASAGVLLKDIAGLYHGQKLSPLRIQYKDFSVWQNALLKNEDIKINKIRSSEKYWLKVFGKDKGEIPVLELPQDFVRPGIQSFEGDILTFGADAELTDRLRALAKDTGTTLYMILLAALNVLLFRYSTHEDIIIGTPVAGRLHADLQSLIGMFVNTLAMRNFPSPCKKFRDFLDEVKENTLRAFENQDFQFEELIEKLELRRDLSRNPLFDVMFALQNMEIETIQLENLKFHPCAFKSRVTKFDMTLNAVETGEEIRFVLEYCTKLFKSDTVERFANHFLCILKSITQSSDVELAEIEMMAEEEKKSVILDFNQNSAEYPKDDTIQQLFEEQVEKIPGHVAVVGEGIQLTFGELEEKANRIARMLSQKGLKKGGIAAVIADRSPDVVAAIIGILKAGGGYLPIDPGYPEDRISFMLEDSGAQILVSKRAFTKKITNEIEMIYIEDSMLNDFSGGRLENSSSPESIAYVIYTSGSTGNPKGTIIEHRNVINLVAGIEKTIYSSYGPYLKVALVAPFVFDASVQQIFASLLLGHTLFVVPEEARLSGSALVKYLTGNRIDISDGTPVHLGLMAEALQSMEDKLQVKHFIIGGDVLQSITLKSFFDRFNRNKPNITNVYGPTECCVDATAYLLKPDELKYPGIVPIGTPLCNQKAFILDFRMKPVPIGVTGELYIGGNGVGRGYLNQPDLTREKFLENPFESRNCGRIYRTGDLARWRPDGNIEFLGRADCQLKIRGFRIEPGEIEVQLLKHEAVTEAVVAAVQESEGIKVLCAYIVSDDEMAVQELREHLNKALPEYMIPTYFVRLHKLPLLKNGKINRRALPAPEAVTGSSAGYAAPENGTQEKLVELWQQVLGVERVGVRDNFFDLGGHSLKAAALTARISKEMHREVSMKSVFTEPTVESLARYIDSLEGKVFKNVLPAKHSSIYPDGCYPVSSAQKRMFILKRMEGEGSSYNMPVAAFIEGDFDKEQIERVFLRLIERHETLRTSFELVEGEPVQRIHEKTGFELDFCEEDRALEKNIDEMVKEFVKPFDLSRAPLLRARLVRGTDQKHLLLCDMHHIISDGVSMGILISEFIELCNGTDLPPLKVQYKDYAVWQNAQLKDGVLKEQEEYWIDRFREGIPTLDLPTDYERPPVQSFEGDRVSFYINEEISRKLERLAVEKGATEYMLVLAVYSVFLAKFTGQEDIVIGSPTAGRHHIDVEKVIGVFLNTLAMRNFPKKGMRFSEFLAQVRDHTLKAFENQDYPFEMLVESLKFQRDGSRNPMFDTLLVMQNQEIPRVETGSLKFVPVEIGQKTAKFDLKLEAFRAGDVIRFNLDYCTSLFRRESVETMAEHFIHVMEVVVSNPEISIGEIGMVAPECEEQMLTGFNEDLENE